MFSSRVTRPLSGRCEAVVVSVVAFVAGHAWFYKLRKSFADII